MSKAEERALEAYPSTSHYWNAESDRNAEAREFYKQGYQQAEKDLELTCDDICEIMEIREDVLEMDSYENLYKEVLKRFKERKENKL